MTFREGFGLFDVFRGGGGGGGGGGFDIGNLTNQLRDRANQVSNLSKELEQVTNDLRNTRNDLNNARNEIIRDEQRIQADIIQIRNDENKIAELTNQLEDLNNTYIDTDASMNVYYGQFKKFKYKYDVDENKIQELETEIANYNDYNGLHKNVAAQNDNLETETSTKKETYSADQKRAFYQDEQTNIIKNVNYYLLLVYYLVVIVVAYMMYVSSSMDLYQKIAVLIVLCAYPYFIQPLETFLYSKANYVYSLIAATPYS